MTRNEAMHEESGGQEGYIFLHSPNSWKGVCEEWAAGRVRYAGKLEKDGDDSDRIVVFVEPAEDPVQSVDERVAVVEGLANPSSSSARSIRIGAYGPTHWSKKKQWGAFLRIIGSDGTGDEVFEWLNPNREGAPFAFGVTYFGHAQCIGDWHVLLELGATSKKALDPLIAQVTDNVGHYGIESVIVNKQKNFVDPPGRPRSCEAWDGRGSNGD